MARGKLNVCYMKGRNNYLCRKKLYDLTDQPVLSGTGRDRALSRHRRLGEDHADRRPRRTGVAARSQRALAQARRALRHLPRPEVQRIRDAASSPKCTGGRRRATSSSSTIICSLPISRSSRQSEHAPDAGILPEAGAVIFDEAHELEDVAGSYFGVSVSNFAGGRSGARCRDFAARATRCCRRRSLAR